MKRLFIMMLIAVMCVGFSAFAETMEGQVEKTDNKKGTFTMSTQDGQEKMVAVKSPESLKGIKKGDHIRVQAAADHSGLLRASYIEIVQ